MKVFLLILFTYISVSHSNAQELTSYKGGYDIGTNMYGYGIKGEVEYSYYNINNSLERIYHGKFHYSEFKVRDNGTKYKLEMTGQFENGLKDGSWMFSINSMNGNEDINVTLTCSFLNGRKIGPWVQKAVGKDKIIREIKVSFMEGRPIGKVNIQYSSANTYNYIPYLILDGLYNEDGSPEGKWELTYSNHAGSKYKEIVSYNDNKKNVEGVNLESGELIPRDDQREDEIIERINSSLKNPIPNQSIDPNFDMLFISSVFRKGELDFLKSSSQIQREKAEALVKINQQKTTEIQREKQEIFDRLIYRAENERTHDESIKLYRKALDIMDSKEVRGKIIKLEEERNEKRVMDSLITLIKKEKPSYMRIRSIKEETNFVRNPNLESWLELLENHFNQENEKHSSASYYSGWNKTSTGNMSQLELYNEYVNYSEFLAQRNKYFNQFSKIVQLGDRKQLREFNKLTSLKDLLNFLDSITLE